MLKSVQLVDFVLKATKRNYFKTKVNLKLIAAYISFWDEPENDTRKKIQKILLKLTNKEVGLDFGDQIEEIQGLMSANYVIKNVLQIHKEIEIKEESKVLEGKLNNLIILPSLYLTRLFCCYYISIMNFLINKYIIYNFLTTIYFSNNRF